MTQGIVDGSAAAAAHALRAWAGACSLAFAILGLFVVFSPAGTSIALAALVLLALLRPRVILDAAAWRNPAVIAGLVLLAYIALHTLWVSWGAQGAAAINRYHELLFIPLLVPLLQAPRVRGVLFRAMLVGAGAWAIAMWVVWFMPAFGGNLQSKRISAGFALSVVAYLALMMSMRMANPWPLRAFAVALAATVLVPIDSRTGHILIVVLSGCAAWVKSPPRWRLAGALATPVLVFAVALAAPGVQSRIQDTMEGGASSTENGPRTSTGIRIELFRLSWDLARKHALAGAGYANYRQEQEAAAVARYAGDPASAGYLRGNWFRGDNPHNEYANQLVGGGVIGLGLFVAWLVLLLREARRMGGAHGAALAGVTIAFAVGCLFNSSLMDFIEGHTFMAIVALLLAEGLHGPAPPPAREAA